MRLKPAELRRLRLRLGLTQEQMAERLGLSERTLRRYETGRKRVPRWLERLARSL